METDKDRVFCLGGSVRWRINTHCTGLHTAYYKNLESKQIGWFPVIWFIILGDYLN